MGVINVPFAIPNVRIENPEAAAHTRIGWFRAVSNIPHAFAVQSFIAELAAAPGRDPKDYLLEVLGPARRISPEALSDTWNHGESPERYPVDTGRLRRVVETVAREAGWGRQLPKGRGLGIAALGEMTFKGGRAEQDNFHTYEVTRMSGAPRETRVHIIPGDYGQPMGGVGEPGVPPIAPAPSTG